jgi:hypothetical protein
MWGLASQENYVGFRLGVIMSESNVFDAPQRKRKEKP